MGIARFVPGPVAGLVPLQPVLSGLQVGFGENNLFDENEQLYFVVIKVVDALAQ